MTDSRIRPVGPAPLEAARRAGACCGATALADRRADRLVPSSCSSRSLAPVLPLRRPNVTGAGNRCSGRSPTGHLLGTDHLGRDILSRLIWGTGLSLLVGFGATLVAAIIGSPIGLVAGYVGGWVDTLLMRLIDILMAFPYMLLALAIVAALGPGLLNALLAIAIVNIPFFARKMRGSRWSLVEREFIEAARLSGLVEAQILFRNPAQRAAGDHHHHVDHSRLDDPRDRRPRFLGLGAQPPHADLGSMLGDGRDRFLAPHVAVIPGIMIFILVIGINLLGDGVRDMLDPRLKVGCAVAAGARAPRRPRASPSPRERRRRPARRARPADRVPAGRRHPQCRRRRRPRM